MAVLENTVSFPRIFSTITGKSTFSVGTTSINESLETLLLTSKGELLGDPEFGTHILKYIHEYDDNIVNDFLTTDIVRAIATYMSKLIIVSEEDVSIFSNEENIYIRIQYYINKTDSIGTYELVILNKEE